mgnify:CR=1 FL=1
MKKILLGILFGSGLLVGSPLLAQFLLPQYSVWEGFAFENKQVVASRETEERFAHFLLGLEHQTPTQQAEQIGALLAKVEQNNATARFLILAEKYLYDPNSPYRSDERYLLFLQYAATHQFADYTSNSRYQKHYAMLQKNRVGMPAAEFPYTTQAGEEGHLYGVQSQYILLFFHDPNCEECQLVKQQLESQHAHFLQKGVQVVAVYIDDEVEAWLKAQYPSVWLSVYAPKIGQQDLYDIKALPTLYLLDTNKYVLQKDARLDKILKYKF